MKNWKSLKGYVHHIHQIFSVPVKWKKNFYVIIKGANDKYTTLNEDFKIALVTSSFEDLREYFEQTNCVVFETRRFYCVESNSSRIKMSSLMRLPTNENAEM
jgi:hypothetical protein